MPDYRVTWDIDIFAHSPKEAAKLARQSLLDPEEAWTVFTVHNGEDSQRIDLLAESSVTISMAMSAYRERYGCNSSMSAEEIAILIDEIGPNGSDTLDVVLEDMRKRQ